MKGKKKKKMYYYMRGWGFAAVVFTVIVIIFSYNIASMVTDARVIKAKEDTNEVSPNIMECSDGPIIDPGGPYKGTEGEYIPFKFCVIGGVPPYDWYIDWGDGTNQTEEKVEEPCLELAHKYTAIGNYTIFLNITDSENRTDDAITPVEVTMWECDLGIKIWTEPCYSEKYPVRIEVTIYSNSEKYCCDDYHALVVIKPSMDTWPIDGKGYPIGPGGHRVFCKDFYLSKGIYNVTATLYCNCNDPNEKNNEDSRYFLVLPDWLYQIVIKIYDLLDDIVDDLDDSSRAEFSKHLYYCIGPNVSIPLDSEKNNTDIKNHKNTTF